MSFNTEKYPGVAEQVPAETNGFRFNHTMLRVKDPERALAFYSHVLGMRVLRRLDFEEMKFSLYFLAKPDAEESLPEDVEARTRWTFSQRGILELTHNWGTEKDPEFEYHDGKSQPHWPYLLFRPRPEQSHCLVRRQRRGLCEAPRRWQDEAYCLHQGSGRLLDRNCPGQSDVLSSSHINYLKKTPRSQP